MDEFEKQLWKNRIEVADRLDRIIRLRTQPRPSALKETYEFVEYLDLAFGIKVTPEKENEPLDFQSKDDMKVSAWFRGIMKAIGELIIMDAKEIPHEVLEKK